MSGTEMKNAVLITLVVLVVLFVLYQYDPSLMGLLRSNEGFVNDSPSGEKDMKSHGNATVNKLPPGASSGPAQQQANSASPPANNVSSGNPQSKKAAGESFKNQPNETKEC